MVNKYKEASIIFIYNIFDKAVLFYSQWIAFLLKNMKFFVTVS